MKIIQAHKFYFMKGGAERYLLDVSAWLEAHGHTVIPFAMRHPDNHPTPYSRYFPSFISTERVRFGRQALRTVGRMLYSIQARRAMASLVTQTTPDLCHVHSLYNQISPSVLHALRDAGVPVVMTVHDHHLISPQYNVWAEGCGEDLREAGLVKLTASKFHKNAYSASFAQGFTSLLHRSTGIYRKNIDLFITPSEYLKRQLVRGGFPEQKIRVNHYGIDVRNTKPVYDHKGYFLYVGRLSEEKGVETIIYAAKLLPDLSFKIVGRGPHMTYLHKLAHDVPNVEFMGFRTGEELQELYRGAMAVVLPSRVHENFPLITLEAMAVGKPVIASDVGGVSEIVQDRLNGMLVKPTDLAGWSEAMMRLAYDDDLRDSLARAARETVDTRFRLEDHYRRLMALYQEVM